MASTFLTTSEAAARIGLQRRTLEKWRVEGRGPRFRKLCGAVRYAPQDLDAWADAATRNSTSDPGPAPDRAV